ncbi:response regulator [Defluviimonas sp. SAOS-178_SWC]|uniref:response regulator n=1 Tax=Defluviimonas sp. SAOS-178_SWC TaxID=3121287 RepID=UPI003221A24C
MKILAVDDDDFILELVPMYLAVAGYQDVSVAASGRAALDLIAAAIPPYDCLLIDINMPEMNGVELCTRVRQIPAYRRTPIIMLTAMTERHSVDTAFAAGATDYVTKPFETMELGVRVRNAEELVMTRLKTADAITSTTPASMLTPGDKPTFSEIQIDGIKELTDHPALKNYLKQLSRAGLLGSQIIAVKLENIHSIHFRATPDELTYAHTEVADSIANVLGTKGLLMANTGNGLFVCASNAPNLLDPIDLEAEIQCLLDDKETTYDDGTPMDIEVSVGKPIRPASYSAADPDVVLDRAIARAESRSQEKKKSRVRLNIRLGSGQKRSW